MIAGTTSLITEGLPICRESEDLGQPSLWCNPHRLSVREAISFLPGIGLDRSSNPIAQACSNWANRLSLQPTAHPFYGGYCATLPRVELPVRLRAHPFVAYGYGSAIHLKHLPFWTCSARYRLRSECPALCDGDSLMQSLRVSPGCSPDVRILNERLRVTWTRF